MEKIPPGFQEHFILPMPVRIWKEFPVKNPREGERNSFFVRVTESGKPLLESQPDLKKHSVWTAEEIPEGEKIIFLDPAKNAEQEFINLDYDVEFINLKQEVLNLRSKENALLQTNTKLLLRKISDLPKTNLLSFLEKDSKGKFLINRSDEINRLLEIRFQHNGFIPILGFHSYIIFFRTILPEPTTFSFGKSINAEIVYNSTAELLNNLNFFIYTYEERQGGKHGIFFKRQSKTEFELVNPQGLEWEETKRNMTKPSRNLINETFKRAGITQITSTPCMKQAGGTCFLWALFFAFNADKTTREAINMIDAVLVKHEMPHTDENRDAVIVQLFYTFVERPVRAEDVNEVDYRKGLGKCRKCGGIRSTVKKGKKSSLPEINEF